MASLADCNRQITELTFVIKQEIKALRAGKYKNIEQTANIKADKMLALAATMTELGKSANVAQFKTHLAPQLARLKSLSIENGLLLSSVMHAIKSVQDRLQILQNNDVQIGVYSRRGQSMSFVEDKASSEKKI